LPSNLNNSVLCERDAKPAEIIDRTVRKAAGHMSDFLKSLPGLLLVEEIARRTRREHDVTCYYDKYTGGIICVPAGTPEIPELRCDN
jgi:hypothetical protein